jgi:hypothetical protein
MRNVRCGSEDIDGDVELSAFVHASVAADSTAIQDAWGGER